MTRFIAVVVLDENTVRVIAKGSRRFCEAEAAGHVLETLVVRVSS